MIENQLDKMCCEFIPLFKKLLACDIYAIAIGGSYGKGLADENSDFDFRLFYEKSVEDEEKRIIYNEINELAEEWRKKGVKVDGVWPRSISQVDEQLDLWLSGKGEPTPYIWSVWGYNILTDIYNLQILEDSFGIIEAWRERLKIYPEALKLSTIKKHAAALNYWKTDYHYVSKVKRGDGVFLSSLSQKLINAVIQIVYALNRFYYPGDGMNLEYTKQFNIKPMGFEERIIEILYPEGSNKYQNQYDSMIKLIDDVLELI